MLRREIIGLLITFFQGMGYHIQSQVPTKSNKQRETSYLLANMENLTGLRHVGSHLDQT